MSPKNSELDAAIYSRKLGELSRLGIGESCIVEDLAQLLLRILTIGNPFLAPRPSFYTAANLLALPALYRLSSAHQKRLGRGHWPNPEG